MIVRVLGGEGQEGLDRGITWINKVIWSHVKHCRCGCRHSGYIK